MSDTESEMSKNTLYRLLEEELNAGELGKVTGYGFSVLVEDIPICFCRALSDKRHLVEDLVTELNDGKADLCQLYFILDDWFGSL